MEWPLQGDIILHTHLHTCIVLRTDAAICCELWICYNYKINILGRSRSVEARAIASTGRAKWLSSYTAARALTLTFFETCVNIILLHKMFV